MRNTTTFTILAMLISIAISAQLPQALNYQAVARNASGAALQNQHVGIRFSIHDGSPTATITYQETDTATTNQFGLFTSLIGDGTVTAGTFAGIVWATGDKYLEVEIDAAGGSNYSNMGTTQLLSVPYALYANSSGTSGQVNAYTVLINGVPITDSSLNFACIAPDMFITKSNYVFNIGYQVSALDIPDSIALYSTVVTDDTVSLSNLYSGSGAGPGSLLKVGCTNNNCGNIPILIGQVYYIPLNASPVTISNLFERENPFGTPYWVPLSSSSVYRILPNNPTITGYNLPESFNIRFARH